MKTDLVPDGSAQLNQLFSFSLEVRRMTKSSGERFSLRRHSEYLLKIVSQDRAVPSNEMVACSLMNCAGPFSLISRSYTWSNRPRLTSLLLIRWILIVINQSRAASASA